MLQRTTERERFLNSGQGNYEQKKGLFWVRLPSFWDKSVLLDGFLWGMERAQVTDYLIYDENS